MTPAARVYWAIALLAFPLSIGWLWLSAESAALSDLADSPGKIGLSLVLLAYTLWGLFDLFISDSNLRRNYPVIANLRYMLEYIRPEIQQYFIANNTEERPFNREARNLIYRRAKGLNDTIPFGTEQDIVSDGYRSLYHSINTTHVPEPHSRFLLGGPQCTVPYSSSRLNISGLSFGALSHTAIEALNRGAKMGNFAHNTGEGSISRYHMEGGDLIWQIGTAYFGCRTAGGRLDEKLFAEKASLASVRAIEIKLSQGAKPSHGGVLPGAKVTREIAEIRTVEVGKTVVSPARHPEFDTPIGLMEFVARIRGLAKGKPVGLKLCLGRKREFMSIVKAMLETAILPDFITVDGAEGGTGAAPVEFSNRLGIPCLEATYFINQVLIGAGIRKDIRIVSAGKTASGFDMLEKIAMGADGVNAGRSMMMALGCIQAKTCNTNRCPTGVATQNPGRARAIDVGDKTLRVYNFQKLTVGAFLELCGALGYDDPSLLKPNDLYIRYDGGLKHFNEIYTPLTEGQLLESALPEEYSVDWTAADARRF
ncbi:MAG: FMN-binding glutamate synthase family protein [Pseudohongiellaceae bacterium]